MHTHQTPAPPPPHPYPHVQAPHLSQRSRCLARRPRGHIVDHRDCHTPAHRQTSVRQTSVRASGRNSQRIIDGQASGGRCVRRCAPGFDNKRRSSRLHRRLHRHIATTHCRPPGNSRGSRAACQEGARADRSGPQRLGGGQMVVGGRARGGVTGTAGTACRHTWSVWTLTFVAVIRKPYSTGGAVVLP